MKKRKKTKRGVTDTERERKQTLFSSSFCTNYSIPDAVHAYAHDLTDIREGREREPVDRVWEVAGIHENEREKEKPFDSLR